MNHLHIILFACLCAISFAKLRDVDEDILNDKPIIGIFAYPSEFYGTYPADQYNYLAASYVKWTEQAGARVIPVPYDLDEDELRSLFSKINGLLFPGGFWSIYDEPDKEIGFGELALGAQRMLKVAIQANQNGDFFPIYGIQSGLQLICALLGTDGTGKEKLFHPFKLQNFATKLTLMRYGTDEMWSYNDKDALDFVSENEAVLYYSNYTMSVKQFLRNEKLRSMFDITALSEDENGQKFIAGVQGKDLPIYGTQFFAIGNVFEWKNSLKLDHNPLTVDFTQFIKQLANFFIQNSRQNVHTYNIPDDKDEILIYNFQAEKIPNDWFEQIYFFDKQEFKMRLQRVNAYLSLQQQQQANQADM